MRPVVACKLQISEEEALLLQSRLAAEVILDDRMPHDICLIAGVDVAYDTNTDRVDSAVAIVRSDDLKIVETAVAEGRSNFPYRPGLFSFREIPAIRLALERITLVPDLILCDGHGIAHPRRFGLASHLGVLYDVPTIGCAKTCLIGNAPNPGPHRGDCSELTDSGDVVGTLLRTRDGVKPIYVSQGHRLSLQTACEWVLRTCPRYRIPEPLRAADHLANEARALWRRTLVHQRSL